MGIYSSISRFQETSKFYDIKVVCKLKDFRKDYNLTQQNVADICGFSQNTICDIENGNYNPSLYTCFKIYFNLSNYLDMLLEFYDLFDFELILNNK